MNKSTITLIETNSGHWYEIQNEEFEEPLYLPSSTTILSCFPNPGLDLWFQTTNYEEIKKKQDEGKRQGTKVHKIIELRIMGQTVLGSGISDAQISLLGLSDKKLIQYLKEPLTEREEEALVGVENFWEEFKPITVASEIMVYSKKYGYAGTADWVGYLWDAKKKKYELWIIDWKISKSVERGYDLQGVSYWKAFEETYGKRYPNMRIGILQLGANKCNYSFKEVKNKKGDLSKDKNKAKKVAWNLFLKTKDIYDDIYPNKKPQQTKRREQFDALPIYKKKGKIINLS
jgi:hypothetical protein